MKMKKGNAGLVVLITVLFITIIAMAGFIAYDKLSEKSGNNILNNNTNDVQNNNEQFKINSLEQAEELMEKYKYSNEVESYYGVNSSKDEVAIFQTKNTEKKEWKTIKEIPSFKNSEEFLLFAGEDGTTTNFWLYEDVMKIKKELFGNNVENVKKQTIVGCPYALVYVDELKGFVRALAPCGSGMGVQSNELNVTGYENLDEGLIIYTKQETIYANTGFEITETTKNKYTFKLQESGYEFDKVEQISYNSVEKEI